jgi:drug/metabolite transporter (DMT)-like permease
MAPVAATANATARIVPLVAVLTLLWGTNWVLFPIAVREISVWTFRSVCLLGAGVSLLLLARAQGLSLHVPRHKRLALAAAACIYLVVWNIGSTYAAVFIPSGQAALLGFTMPVWATLLSWALQGQAPSRRMVVSLLLASAGIGLLLVTSRGASANALAGFGLGLAAAVGWAGGTMVLKQARLDVPAIVSTAWQLLIAGIPVTLVAIAIAPKEPFVPSWTTVATVGYITLVPMAIGNVLWFSIVNRVSATVSGLSTMMVPVVAMVTGSLVHHEPFGVLEACAMALCCASLGVTLVGAKAVDTGPPATCPPGPQLGQVGAQPSGPSSRGRR